MRHGFSFPREHRLLKPGDYRFVFNRPKKLSNRYLTVLVRPNGLGYPRLGMAISKKTVKHAVYRNRLKRIVREGFRRNSPRLKNLDIVVLARKGVEQKLYSDDQDLLTRIWADLSMDQSSQNRSQ